MEKERINVLIGSDINYAPYYGVMLTSLLMNNAESVFNVYLLTDNSWTDKETIKFEKLCNKYRSNFYVNVVDEKKISICPLNPENHIARSTYYRLMASELLPTEVQKVIYMDGDMIVRGEINALWNIDISNVAIAGAIDPSQFNNETYVRLNFDKKFGYFNAGVELINLRYWRENNISKQAIEFIESHKESLPLMDQDVVNTILADKKVFIPIRYNFQTMLLTKYFYRTFTDIFKKEVLENMLTPIIIHYNGGVKPWHWRYYALPYRKEWLQAYWHSSWFFAYEFTPITKYIKHLIKRIVHRKALITTQRNQYIQESHEL